MQRDVEEWIPAPEPDEGRGNDGEGWESRRTYRATASAHAKQNRPAETRRAIHFRMRFSYHFDPDRVKNKIRTSVTTVTAKPAITGLLLYIGGNDAV
jgi:hypothetical protein